MDNLLGSDAFSSVNLYGMIAVSFMMLCDSLEQSNRYWTLLFGVACWMGASYGFLSGAWPFGVIEFIWGGAKFLQFYAAVKEGRATRF